MQKLFSWIEKGIHTVERIADLDDDNIISWTWSIKNHWQHCIEIKIQVSKMLRLFCFWQRTSILIIDGYKTAQSSIQTHKDNFAVLWQLLYQMLVFVSPLFMQKSLKLRFSVYANQVCVCRMKWIALWYQRTLQSLICICNSKQIN